MGTISRAVRLIHLAALAVIATSPVSASVSLPTGSDPSSDLLINFDFTSVTPLGPPYVDVIYFVTLDPTNASGTVAVDLFGDLNGGDLLASFTTSPPLFDNASTDGRIGDGLFSLGVRATPGSVGAFVEADAFGIKLICDNSLPPNCSTVQGPDIAGELVRTSAPEPATLALFGIGLAGLGFSRRRKRT